jgi:predicted SprT family Zn-dependent metalloprotease
MISITKQEYSGLEQAYRFFDEKLFSGVLPDCMIVLNRKAGARGYFSGERFENRGNSDKADEVALNPDHFIGRSDLEILSTLVHEQVHVWQFHHGDRPTRAYHDRQWADRMESIGLMPTNTGQPGGKRTGRKVTHYIIAGGPFDVAAQELFASGFKLNWQSPSAQGKEKPKSKVKYTCGCCGLNAWAKPKAHLMCGDCEIMLASE